jgi:hypothetical protein
VTAYRNGHNGTHLCAECELPQFARNHYFTGKLLVERDFTDEQRYFMGKDRRHNQRLHGSGTVCGLKVTQHPVPECRDRYVIVEPGTAVDCCGREITLLSDEYFDFRSAFEDAWKDAHGSASMGNAERTFQICLGYRECSAEEVPALFDECGEEGCRPNRILEGHDLSVRLVEGAPPGDALARAYLPTLRRSATIQVVEPTHVALSPAGDVVYVAKAGTPGTITAFRTSDQSLLGALNINGIVTDLAVSADGQALFAAVGRPGAQRDLFVARIAPDLSTRGGLLVPGDATDPVRLATAPDGSLYALNGDSNVLYGWSKAVTAANSDRRESAPLDGDPGGIAVSPDGGRVFVAEGDKGVAVVDVSGTAAALPSLDSVEIAGVAVTELAASQTSAGPRLWVADETGPALHAFAVPSGDDPEELGDPLDLPGEIMALGASDYGRFVLALMSGQQGPELQLVDAARLEEGAAGALGSKVAVAGARAEMALGPAAAYVVFSDPPAAGVAVIDVVERSCGELFKRTIDGCPACAEDDGCVVLATIDGYRPGESVSDADIDNLSDRHLLPSTDVITEVVRCLLARGGPRGPAGPPGPQGPAAASRVRTDLEAIDTDANGVGSVTVTHGLGSVPVAVTLGVVIEQFENYYAVENFDYRLWAQVPAQPYDGKFTIELVYPQLAGQTLRVRWWAFAE